MGKRLALSIFLLASAAFAREPGPGIDHLTAVAVNGQVSVHFMMSRAFDDPQTIEAIQSGVPTSFTYVIEIYRDRPNWFDEGIARSRIQVITTYNSVTREYLLNYRRDHRLVRSETTTDLATLRQRMTTIDETNLFDIGTRRPYKVKVRVKADLRRGWLLYFIPWEVSTRWAQVRVSGEQKP